MGSPVVHPARLLVPDAVAVVPQRTVWVRGAWLPAVRNEPPGSAALVVTDAGWLVVWRGGADRPERGVLRVITLQRALRWLLANGGDAVIERWFGGIVPPDEAEAAAECPLPPERVTVWRAGRQETIEVRAAEVVASRCRWDGTQWISVHTATPVAEWLLRSPDGGWAAYSVSRVTGGRVAWPMTEQEALHWLVVNQSYEVVCRYFGELPPSPAAPDAVGVWARVGHGIRRLAGAGT